MNDFISLADQPLVSLRMMQTSSLVLSDMAALYLPLHGVASSRFFDHYATLAWVEAQVYAMEIATGRPNGNSCSLSDFWGEQRTRILALIRSERLESAPLEQYLDEVGAYFSIVCKRGEAGRLSHREIMDAAELRSSDLRLLHAILLQRLKMPHDDVLFTLLWPLEVLLEIEANIAEQDADRETGHFNPYLLLFQLHGPEAPNILAAERSRLHTLFKDRMTQSSPELQQRVRTFIKHYKQAYPTIGINPGSNLIWNI